MITDEEQKILDDFKIKEDYIIKLNYFRYNLAHADESTMLPPQLVEIVMADALRKLRIEMEEKGIKIPGYNI